MKKIFLLLAVSLSLSVISNGQYSVLLNFSGINGAQPDGGHLTLAGKKLYGIAAGGGMYGGGCIYSIDTDGSNYHKLYDFTFVTSPSPSLVISGKNLYGITGLAGAYNYGYIFSIDTTGNNFRDLFDFYSDSVGVASNGSLTLVGNKLYGMTPWSGTYSSGCIFSVDTNGFNYKDIFNFNGINGSHPNAELTFFNNRLYGMTLGGGTNDSGCVFSIDTDGTAYRKILDFNGKNGKNPYNNDVIIMGNTIYGMTAIGGSHNSGCIFSIDTNGSSYKKLLDFNIIDGASPECSLILSKGVLYGAAAFGGTDDSGLIFSIDTNGTGYKKLVEFNGLNGKTPVGSLIINRNILYGITERGGSDGDGVIFKIDTSAIAGIDNIQAANEILKVYPNPSSGIFTLVGNEEMRIENEKSVIEVYNMLGKKVYSSPSSSVNYPLSIDLTNQPNGVYLCRIVSGKMLVEGKLVLQK